jgi:hypothetical protein
MREVAHLVGKGVDIVRAAARRALGRGALLFHAASLIAAMPWSAEVLNPELAMI